MNKFIENSKLFLKKNSPTILTCAGAIGVIATAISAVAATPKAMRIIEMNEIRKGDKLTKSELVRCAGHVYIPSILIGTSTIACIFGANFTNQRQQASLLSLYSLVDSSYKEYKEKTTEIFGEEAEKKIMDAIAMDRYSEESLPEKPDGKDRYMDYYSFQVFDSTKEDIETAERFLNDILRMRGSVYLDEYFLALGLPSGMCESDMGWTAQSLYEKGFEELKIKREPIITKDGEECYILSTPVEPSWIN